MKIFALLALAAIAMVIHAAQRDPLAPLAAALLREDPDAIRAAVSEGRAVLGGKAGIPEVPDEFRAVPATAKLMSAEDARRGFTPHFQTLERIRWWKVGVDPTTLTAPLRAPASVIAGNVAAVRAGLDGREKSLAMANEAADFLMWAQDQAGPGLFPFPAARGTSDARAMQVATRFLEKAEKAGRLGEIVRNGWVFEDGGDGALQFDNGECGVAMFELFELTRDPRHLASARKAADWALARPLCTNWNYNAFTVHLLAKAHSVTGEARYLDAAIRKARLGVLPGQLTDGPRAGRWMDPHNARPAYHFIMMQALAALTRQLPRDHEHRAEILGALSLGLKARNSEMVSQGVMNKDHAIETLLAVNREFADDDTFLRETRSAEALNVLARLVSEEARRGRQPLSPGAWGHFLEFIAAQK